MTGEQFHAQWAGIIGDLHRLQLRSPKCLAPKVGRLVREVHHKARADYYGPDPLAWYGVEMLKGAVMDLRGDKDLLISAHRSSFPHRWKGADYVPPAPAAAGQL